MVVTVNRHRNANKKHESQGWKERRHNSMARVQQNGRVVFGGKAPRTAHLSGKGPRRAGMVQVGRKRRYRPGTLALREIRRYQKSTDLLIPRRSFHRLVREIMFRDLAFEPKRIQSEALLALQEASEHYLVDLFQKAVSCAIHARRVTVNNKDIALALSLAGNTDRNQ
jgi:histone H3